MLEHGDQIAPAYRAGRRLAAGEDTLGLPGYPGGKVVVGNWVNGQFQLDAMGEVLQLLARAAEHDHLDADGHRAMQTTVDVIATRWQEPEAGIWELSDAWWTQSRLSVVAGLRAAARQLVGPQAEALRGPGRRRPGPNVRDAAFAPTARGDAAPSTTGRTPACCCRPSAARFPPRTPAPSRPSTRSLASSPRTGTSTGSTRTAGRWARPRERSCSAGSPWRSPNGTKGARREAARWYERTAAACGSPGLLAEEYDVRQRQLRGNLPQGFVHALLLETGQQLAIAPSG